MSLVVNNEFSRPDEHLYLYEDGRHYAFSEQLPMSDWIKFVTDREEWRSTFDNHNCPPILSNLKLDVNHPDYSLETMDREQSEHHEAAMYNSEDIADFDIRIRDRL
jgi:hypothetical protein